MSRKQYRDVYDEIWKWVEHFHTKRRTPKYARLMRKAMQWESRLYVTYGPGGD